ncbi:hypothetical protein EV363DRAFT_1396693 [Boletus edulis]|nr:hypothetical protein EV363DRAFT_1396693 [Boletus edulis]
MSCAPGACACFAAILGVGTLSTTLQASSSNSATTKSYFLLAAAPPPGCTVSHSFPPAAVCRTMQPE